MYVVRKLQRIFIRQYFASLCMLSAKCSDFTSASSFLLCVYCPQNVAMFYALIVYFFVYIVRKMQRYLFVSSFRHCLNSQLNKAIFQPVSSFLLCICCPQTAAIIHLIAVSFFVYIVRKKAAILLRRYFPFLSLLFAK